MESNSNIDHSIENPKQIPNNINDFQEMFKQIYGEKNRLLTIEKIVCHITEEAGEVAKDMRHEDYKKLSKDIPDIFAWLCAFANKKKIVLEEEVWKKYPGICPYCSKEKACICISEGSKTKKYDDLLLCQENGQRPNNFFEWNSLFTSIYGNVNRILSHSAVGYHLMEEIGELARSIRKDPDKDLGEEAADVFAWLIAVTMKLKNSMGIEISLDKLTFEKYEWECPHCYKEECGCKKLVDEPRY